MSKKIAFFDVDETLIRIKSMFSFRRFYFRFLSKDNWEREEKKFQFEIDQNIANGADRSAINTLFYKAFRNCEQTLLRNVIDSWYREVRNEPGFFVSETLCRLHKHQARDDVIAFVSGSAIEFLTPLAKELNVNHLLATTLEVKDGIYTGNIVPPQIIGYGKKAVAQKLSRQLQISLSECYAYGDHFSDLPLLEAVGYPHVVAVVSPDVKLLEHAEVKNWPTLKE